MSAADERRAQHARYKEDVETRGESVLPLRDVPRHGDEPRGRLRDRRASPCVWYFTGDRDQPGEEGTGWLGVALRRRRPTRARRASCRVRTGTSTSSSTSCGSSSGRTRVILGTVGIPTIALILLHRAAVPRPPDGAAAAAPAGGDGGVVLTVIAMGVLTYKGATAKEAGAAGAEEVDEWIADNNLRRRCGRAPSCSPPPAASTATTTSATAPPTWARPT